MLRRVALVRTDISEEISASFIRVTRIGELGTTLPVTSNRRTLSKKYKLIAMSLSLPQMYSLQNAEHCLQITYHANRRWNALRVCLLTN
jgi:hypothetical protein